MALRRSAIDHCARNGGQRSPRTVTPATTSSISRRSPSVSPTQAAPMFRSSRCILAVPGTGMNSAPASFRSAHWARASSPGHHRGHRAVEPVRTGRSAARCLAGRSAGGDQGEPPSLRAPSSGAVASVTRHFPRRRRRQWLSRRPNAASAPSPSGGSPSAASAPPWTSDPSRS
jgi:hypothetical protein